ncbi:MerR family transcriptional regulator [Agromyces sp. Root1464]|uniref:MerR family transcriptional regulator n=1 Tax=Agromyces sp. Root1464 TaxID=1736467 RepID=UPI0006F7BC69|nr:MerR family transcriptional regulator [Agromyces sp. Root1464]KQZ08178.1 MerR family transcriptional regulator [Agromyces sp. Root1464]
MKSVQHSLSIAEAAERTGLSTHTLRYYERAGLMLTAVDRASSRHRRYSDDDIVWVGFLTKLRSALMPIAQVREYVDLVRLGEATRAARLDLLQRHRVRVVAKLDDISQALSAIDAKIAIYSKESGNE